MGNQSCAKEAFFSRLDVFGLVRCLYPSCLPSPPQLLAGESQAIFLSDRPSRQKSQGSSPTILYKELSQALLRRPILEQPPSPFLMTSPPSPQAIEGVLFSSLLSLGSTHAPGKLDASGAWAWLCPNPLHIQARPFPIAGWDAPAKEGVRS